MMEATHGSINSRDRFDLKITTKAKRKGKSLCTIKK